MLRNYKSIRTVETEIVILGITVMQVSTKLNFSSFNIFKIREDSKFYTSWL